ncbi:hypothetical protein ACFRMN_05115 [Streptomyces sp. NPDC056835]|uniref:hypothetical protein n=1 Tax=Streptomyces sp. NPDC056835 TaxID=3345956 RepID=UPI0036C5BB26
MIPPPPSRPPTPPPPPPGPADPARAVAVALLNLTGLGLGYALMRRRLATAVCVIVTGVLLVIALPAEPDGVSGGVLTTYLVFLALAAGHGAVRGLRTPLAWPPRSPVAVLLGLVLLAAPVGGVVLYDGAREEATQQMLLDRLGEADQLVRTATSKPFEAAEPDYTKALGVYRDLSEDHADSRAAERVPDRLNTYYKTVGAPYDERKYCEAIAPLNYLRSVPDTIGEKELGSLAGWPDDRLATSLYECGLPGLGSVMGGAETGGHLYELLTTFPRSPQAARVEPAVSSAIDKVAKDLKGGEPCTANETMRNLAEQAKALPGDAAGLSAALDKDAGKARKHVQAGMYACGVDQYRDGKFGDARDTMNDFVGAYKNDKNRALAKKIAIAAEIAQDEPAAGKRLPTMASGGGITVTISNDSPEEVEILYTGPVTGSVKLKACDGCRRYQSSLAASSGACQGGENYPSKTITLPAGTTYFLHKSTGGSASTGTDTTKIEPGYTYTECAYVVEGLGTGF